MEEMIAMMYVFLCFLPLKKKRLSLHSGRVIGQAVISVELIYFNGKEVSFIALLLLLSLMRNSRTGRGH